MDFKLNQIWLKLRPYLIFIFVITIMIFWQLKTRSTLFGNDTFFHFSRFYDTAMQINTGKFNWFQTNFGFQHSGRIINAVYGPYFAYLNGLILILCKNWFIFQIVSDYLICLLGASSMLHLLKSLKIPDFISISLSVIYINVGYIPSFLTQMTFSGWGQAIMPWILLCGVKMLEKPKWTTFDWVDLGLVVALIFQIHVLSAVLSILLLVPFFIIGIIKQNNKIEFILNIIKAIFVFIILSFNSIYSLYIVFNRNKVILPQRFDLSTNSLHVSLYHFNYANVIGSVENYILPIFIVLIILQLIYTLKNLKLSLTNNVVTIWGFFLLLISSKIFPWQIIQRIIPSLGSSFQFPSRLVIIAYPLIILGFALTLNLLVKKNTSLNKISKIILLLLTLETLAPTFVTGYRFRSTHLFSEQVQAQSKLSDKSALINNEEFSVPVDYLPTRLSNIEKAKYQYEENVIKQFKNFKRRISGDGSQLILWNGKTQQKITLPIILYSQSDLKVNGQEFNGKKNSIGNPRILQRKGKNTAKLNFDNTKNFPIFTIINLIFWGIILVSLCFFREINIKKKYKE